MPYAGFDTSLYPVEVRMRALAAQSNLVWCGFYLAPAPAHPGRQWMGEYAALRAMGWGLAPIYVGLQQDGPGSPHLDAARGRSDALDAVRLLAEAGFPQGSRLFLDVESGDPPTPAMAAYAAAWFAGVRGERCRAGVYCSYRNAAAWAAADPQVAVWVWRLGRLANPGVPPFPQVPPADSGHAAAVAWQWAQDDTITVAGTVVSPVDLSVATTPDPSAN